jgi:7-cyano-7-deazaguanine synthase
MSQTTNALAVLVSGGLDSAILVGEALSSRSEVYPLYVRTGLAWESVEFAYLQRFLDAVASPRLHPVKVLNQPVNDLYGDHWSLTGHAVPDAESPDEAVFLPGRNVLLLSKAILWCHMNRIPALAMAPLAANPFPDATPEFFRAYQSVVNSAVEGSVRLEWPYLHLEKAELLRRSRNLPLALTFSCIRPVDGHHCGVCNKCAERRRAFIAAEVPDPTRYLGAIDAKE